uniref:Uncharacterized protein n=1 Tax=Arundo donax TaxID=35708 RepID=A0A0A9EF99_ARUDO
MKGSIWRLIYFLTSSQNCLLQPFKLFCPAKLFMV